MKKIFTSLCLMGSTLSRLALCQDGEAVKTILLEGPDGSKQDVSSWEGVVVQDLNVPGGSAAIEEKLKPYIGAELSKEMLLNVKSDIISYYAENQHPYLIVEIPEQEVVSGRVRYIIMEGKVGDIFFTGNRWFSDKQLERYIRLKRGDAIDEGLLLNNVASLNRNPFHFSEVILERGKTKGLTNIEIRTQDRFPFRVFGGVDNTGNPFTGNTRNYGGFNWGNAFFINDLLTYQFTTADNYHTFWSHFGNYTSYLSIGHTLSLYGGYSEIHPSIRHFKSEGKSYQGSLRYTIPVKPYYKSMTQEFGMGFDIKGMNSSLFFSDVTGPIPVSQHLANLFQFAATYGVQQKSANNKLSFNLECFFSPFLWMANQNNKRFGEIRPHALARYGYGRVFLADVWTLPMKFSIASTLRLQGAVMPLMPSEQFALGGYSTVRGYDEHAFNADAAVCANLEVRMPPFKVFPRFNNAMTFLAFTDFGSGHNFKNDFSQVPSTEYLFSAGPGVRYEIYPYLSMRADYGFKFHKFVNSGPSNGKFHFSVTASY